MSGTCGCGCGCGGLSTCGCCDGIAIATPVSEINPPGLSAINYRAGTYATFYETMLARLSNLWLDVPSTSGTGTNRIYPLKQLTTRELTDPSIALLDAWAVVADVLTFYQERIANEGYLPTAIERRSILELARLVGYRLRPGVSASVYLGFTVVSGFQGDLPAGTRAQSIPGAGESPQFFETSDVLNARDTWNDLKPRLTRPQLVKATNAELAKKTALDADVIDSVYLAGTATNLQPNNLVLFVRGNERGEQFLRTVATVDAQADDKRTQVTLVQPLNGTLEPAVAKLFVDKATKLFPNNSTAADVAALMAGFAAPSDPITGDVSATVTKLRYDLAVAEQRGFTRLAAMIRHAIAWLNQPRDQTVGSPFLFDFSGLALITNLFSLYTPLSLAPSLQPANSIVLKRSVTQSFAPESAVAQKLITALAPARGIGLYQAWVGTVQAPGPFEVHAMRVRAALFASNYPGPATVSKGDSTTTSFDNPPDISNAWAPLADSDATAPPSAVALDTTYNHIQPGSWVAINRPGLNDKGSLSGARIVTFHLVRSVRATNMDTHTGFAAKATVLTLTPQWLADAKDFSAIMMSNDVLRDTVAFAQSEPLDLAEEPIDADVMGDSIELDGVYDGLQAGRWIIVSGTRSDIPNVVGVTASELVMLAGVAQVPQGPLDLDTVPGKPHTVLTLANKLAYTYDAATVAIYGNVAKATHGQTVGEVLGDGDATKAFQTLALRQPPLTYVSAPTPAGADTTLTLRVNEIEWHETDNLAGAGPRDRTFVTWTNDDDQTSVVFGNGTHGARVPTGTANVKATYRYGIGKAGNVAAGQISQLATHPLGAQAVINPLAASGGADRDTADQARRNTPLAVMALDRLVSVRDYADFARTYAGIGKASAARLSDGRRTLVHLTVAGNDDIPIDQNSDLYNNLVASLQTFGDPHLPIAVAVRRVKLLVVSAGVKILPDYAWESVEPKIRAAMLDHFSFASRDLGQPAFLSDAVRLVQGIDGVAYTDVSVFDSVAEDVSAESLVKLSTALKVNQYVTADLARIGPSSTAGILPAELAFMTPDIPDTLILSRIGG